MLGVEPQPAMLAAESRPHTDGKSLHPGPDRVRSNSRQQGWDEQNRAGEENGDQACSSGGWGLGIQHARTGILTPPMWLWTAGFRHYTPLMSFFGHDHLDLLSDDELPELEIADGVILERRSVLWLSAASVAAMLTGSSQLAAQSKQGKHPGKQDTPRRSTPKSTGDGTLNFAQFLAEVYPLAKRLVASGGKGEEVYLLTIAAAMARLANPKAEMGRDMRAFAKQHREAGKRFPISTMSLRLAPGRGFDHHDHRNYNGVIMGLEGEVRIRNFDFLGDEPVPAMGKTFQIRETRDDLILPGRFSSLGRRRENIHELRAGPGGGRVLDVFTFFGRGATSKIMNVDEKPRDAKRRIYDAAW